jgi:hypothetical protein
MRFPEQYRVTPALQQKRRDLKIPAQFVTTSDTSPDYGLFLLPRMGKQVGTYYRVVASRSPEQQWEHASVTLIDQQRCPTWAEMCYVKELFWEAEDAVAQFHPPRSEYVNLHPFCLHLWRPLAATLPRPPQILVG